LKKTGVLALKDSDLPKYVVDAKNELKVLSLPESVAYRAKEIEAESSSYNIARAAAGEREIYEGSWLVKDTSVRDYITIFTATDSQGNKEKLVLAWSDPCLDTTSAEWPLNPNGGNVDAKTVGCTISSVYGIDNGSLTLNSGANINVDGAGGILVLNPDKGLKFPTTGFGQLTFSSGGSYKPGYLWATDYDNDHYAAASTRQYTSTVSSPGSGYVRQSSLLSWTNDCDDFNTNVKPGQTKFFADPIVDSGGSSEFSGTFDYNCNGMENAIGWNNYNATTSLAGVASGYEMLCSRIPHLPVRSSTNDYFTPTISSYSVCGIYVHYSPFYADYWYDASPSGIIESTCDPAYYDFAYYGNLAIFCN